MKRKPAAACAALLMSFCLAGCDLFPFTPPTDLPAVSQLPDPTPTAEPEATPEPGGNKAPGSIAGPGNREEDEEEYISLEELREHIRDSGAKVGVAFVGYVDSQGGEVDLRDYVLHSATGVRYPFLNFTTLFMDEGQELYALVPYDEDSVITLYRAEMSDQGEYIDDLSNPLSEGLPGEPLLVRCNLSEIYSSILVTATYGDEIIEIRPGLSMEDGQMPEQDGVYDFSDYAQVPDEGWAEQAGEMLSQTDEVNAALELGMKLRYTGQMQVIQGRWCLLFALGTDREDQFVTEGYYGVCHEAIYAYDALSDTWMPCGMG